jgi:hypothetical protein
MIVTCRQCGGETQVVIDCQAKPGTSERTFRNCPICNPLEPGRRYVVDRRATYSFEERLFDLTAGIPANTRTN